MPKIYQFVAIRGIRGMCGIGALGPFYTYLEGKSHELSRIARIQF